MKKVKEAKPSLRIPSENALLAEKSFLLGEEERATRNGYYLEGRNKKPRNTSPTSEEGPEKVGLEDFFFFSFPINLHYIC